MTTMTDSQAYRIGYQHAMRVIDTSGSRSAAWRADLVAHEAHRVAALALRETPLQSGVEPGVYECQATAAERAAAEAAGTEPSRTAAWVAIGQRLLSARLGATWASEYEAGWRAACSRHPAARHPLAER